MEIEIDEVIVKPKSPIVRTIGVEIECLVPVYSNSDRSAIEDAGGSVHHDSSIDGSGEGIEVKTSPISGNHAEETLHGICDVLASMDADTNSTCGLHVHVDASELNVKNYVRLLRFGGSPTPLQDDEKAVYIPYSKLTERDGSPMLYEVIDELDLSARHNVKGSYGPGIGLKTKLASASWGIEGISDRYGRTHTYSVVPPAEYENIACFAVKLNDIHVLREKYYNAMSFFSAIDPILRSLVPSGRRHNTYCQPFNKVTRNGGTCPDTMRDIVNGVSTRYCGVNFRALDQHGTIENRYHGGSTNATKIIHWARLWERCVDLALSNHAQAEADNLAEVLNGKNRLEMLCALLDLPEDTSKYLMGRYTAFMGSDARHAIAYINGKKKRRAVTRY